MKVTVSVAIMQLKVSVTLMSVKISAANKWETIFIEIIPVICNHQGSIFYSASCT